jgi:hypothetical protein
MAAVAQPVVWFDRAAVGTTRHQRAVGLAYCEALQFTCGAFR